MSDAAEPLTTTSISRFTAWVRDLPARTSKNWLEIAATTGVSVDQLRRLRGERAQPRARTLEALFAVFGQPDWGAELIEQARQRALAQGRLRQSERAQCARCDRLELVSQIRGLASFRPAAAGRPATFIHPRRCKPRPENPFVPALDAARVRMGRRSAPDNAAQGPSTWHPVRRALRKAGVQIDIFRILNGRTVPPPDIVPAISKALRFPPEDEATWGEVSRKYWTARRRTHPAGPVPKAPRATCRGGCGRSELVSKVRKPESAEFDEGPPATYLCSDCRRTKETTLVCPVVGCPSPSPRSEYKSRRWKRDHRDQRRGDGAYGVPDDECHKKIMGASATRRLREVLFPKFEVWFREQSSRAAAHDQPIAGASIDAWFAKQSRSTRKVSAREVWDGAAPEVRFPTFERWFRSSKYGQKFSPPSVDADESHDARRERNVARTLYRLVVKAWGQAHATDIRGSRKSQLGVHRGPLGNLRRWVRQWEQWAGTAEGSVGTYRVGDPLTQARIDRLTGAGWPPTSEQIDGSERLSTPQIVLLGSGTAPALARCWLCTKILNTKAQASRAGRRLHTSAGLCSEAWRRSPEYRTKWKGRRWGTADRGAAIDPPRPAWAAPTTDKGLARKHVWFIKHYIFDQSFREIAVETMEIAAAMGNPTTVSQPAVKQGIDDFIEWLPADLSLAFPRPGMQRLVEDALDKYRRAQMVVRRKRTIRAAQNNGATERQQERDTRLIRWLTRRWGMSAAAVARLVEFSADEVTRLLKTS